MDARSDFRSGEKVQDRLPLILAETARWWVVSKPAGVLTIPGRQTWNTYASGSKQPLVLSVWMREHFGEIWVVHRLDRETSGIVLFARTREDHRQANLWFQKHQIKKTYHILAMGQPFTPVFKIHSPIQGVPSITQVEVRESYHEGFFARVIPLTGRRHQIRIHLASKGYPIWGDIHYRGPNQVILSGKVLNISRVALHAAKLELPTGEIFTADWPEDFRFWLERLQGEGSLRF